jgi:hypothetical protein
MRDGGSCCLRRLAYRISTTSWDSNGRRLQKSKIQLTLLLTGRHVFEPSRQLRAISGQIAEQSIFDFLDCFAV